MNAARNTDLTCPVCTETGGVEVFYTAPLRYQCMVCGHYLRDANNTTEDQPIVLVPE